MAHVVNEITPAGKEMGIVKLLSNLDNKKFDCSLIVFQTTEQSRLVNVGNLPIILTSKKDGNDWQAPFKLCKIFKKSKFDIVHTHSWGTLIEGILGSKLARVPIIIHNEHGSFPSKWYHKILQRFFWNLSNRVLSVSQELKQRISQTTHFPASRIDVILNGVKESNFFPSATLRKQFRRKFNFSQEDFLIGTIGRFSEVKNQSMLLRAASELIQKGDNIKIILVSSGKKKEDLRLLSTSLGISHFTHFLDIQMNVNMLLNGFDIFALTSFSEGCSNVIQEAMFCQKAIIATDVGGNPELIQDQYTGFLVESNNHEQLAQKLRLLKENPDLREKLGKRAQQTAQENFTLTRMIQAYEKLYEDEFNKKYLHLHN